MARRYPHIMPTPSSPGSSKAVPAQPHFLVPIAGPEIQTFELPLTDKTVTLGRHEGCELLLPPGSETVSRFHARLRHASGQWYIVDLKSRWGTFLNGVKLSSDREMLLTEGDLIRISPWTFSFSAHKVIPSATDSANDAGTVDDLVRTITAEQAQPLAEQMLNLLLECASSIHAAGDEHALAEALLDAASRGSGMPNVALLRPVDATGRIEVILAKTGNFRAGQAVYSRSLLRAASTGHVAEFTGGGSVNFSESIAQMNITAALCVPLMMGTTVAAYLYLDTRGEIAGGGPRPHASSFCLALGRMAGLALANLKRMDIERRQTSMEAELNAGAEAQRWILPKRVGSFGRVQYIGESKPGMFVGGDFFDVIPLSDKRVAVALGDVTGKGVSASVLMTASQGFLHACLQQHGDAAKAVNALCQFVSPRCPDTRFVTLWVGIIDTQKNTLTYVDAGHGYGVMVCPDGRFLVLTSDDGPPVGIAPDFEYTSQSVPLTPGGRLLIVSDGIVEQPAAQPDIAGIKPLFELEGVRRVMQLAMKQTAPPPGQTMTPDPVAALFEAVIQHAGSSKLGDDATIVLAKWD